MIFGVNYTIQFDIMQGDLRNKYSKKLPNTNADLAFYCFQWDISTKAPGMNLLKESQCINPKSMVNPNMYTNHALTTYTLQYSRDVINILVTEECFKCVQDDRVKLITQYY